MEDGTPEPASAELPRAETSRVETPVVTPEPAPRHNPGMLSRRSKPSSRRTRVVVRRVGPISVLKFSLIFYFCVMLIVFLGLLFLYAIMGAIGVNTSLAKFLGELFGTAEFKINGSWIFTRVFLVGCGLVVVWSLINVMVAFLYNLISDLVGGIEITLAEKR
jgi:hypothetical protein